MFDLDSDDLANVALLIEADRKRKKKRSKWCKSWLQKRDKLSHNVLLEQLRSEPKNYLNYLRMDEPIFLELLSLVTPIIEKQGTTEKIWSFLPIHHSNPNPDFKLRPQNIRKF